MESVVVGVTVGVVMLLFGYLFRRVEKAAMRKAELERRALVDKAVELALKAIDEKLDTGNGQNLAHYVMGNDTKLKQVIQDIKELRITVGDVDDRLTDHVVAFRAMQEGK